MVIWMLGGAALGLLVMSSAPAIVTYFLVPTAVGSSSQTVPAAEGPSRWIDLGQATAPLGDASMAAGDWARLAVAVALWVGLPLATGFLRLRRREVSSWRLRGRGATT